MVAAVSALAFGLAAIALLGFSPTLNPTDLLAGRFFEEAVPRVTEMTQTSALVALDSSRLVGRVEFDYSASVSRGKVIRQRPEAGDSVDRDSTVVITVSRGPQVVAMPDFVGGSERAARDQLRDWEIDVAVERVNDEATKKDQVISQSVRPGTQVLGGSSVSFVVSLGPVTRPVPNVVGLGVEGAAFRLGEGGFLLGELTFEDDATVPSGGVVRSEPPAGTVVDKDSPIALVISSGPPAVPVPRVVGRQQGAAAETLAEAGFLVGEISQLGPIADPDDGKVLDQKPSAGVVLRPGEVVTLTVRRAAKPPPTTLPAPITAPTTAPTTVPVAPASTTTTP